MGLDIYTANTSMRVGSYSGVQFTRLEAIKFFIRKLEQIEPKLKEEPEEEENDSTGSLRTLRRHLTASVQHSDSVREPATPDYAYFPVKCFLYDLTGENEYDYNTINRALCGLNAWVDHSDCDGLHSPGQAEDVGFCFEWLTDQVPETYSAEESSWISKDYWIDLTEFYKNAACDGQIIFFG